MSAAHTRRTSWPRLVAIALIAGALVAATGCDDDNGSGGDDAEDRTPSAPAEIDGVEVSGDARLDGQPFDSRWVGAVVLKDGLVTPCQSELPPVENGRFTVPVFAETASSGCGAPGDQVVLWTFANETIVFSTEATPWPRSGRRVRFDPSYSLSTPAGAAPETAQFTGAVSGPNGRELPAGTRVDAYVGETLCGTASVRSNAEFTGYILSVVGPDTVPGCTRGSTLTFRIDGRPAAPTTVTNTPPGQRESLDLALA